MQYLIRQHTGDIAVLHKTIDLVKSLNLPTDNRSSKKLP